MRKVYLILIIFVLIFISCSHRNKAKENNKPASSIENLSQKLSNDPKNSDLYNERAKLYIEKKETDNALSDISKALEINPKKADYYCTLSDIYLLQGKIAECGNSLNKALSIEPNNTMALLKFAELSFYFKKYDKTFEYIKKALDIDKMNPQAYFMRGMALKEYGDTAKAVADFHTATEQDPQFYDAYVQLGLLYSIKKNMMAVDFYNNAINVQPNNIEARYNKGMFYQEVGDYKNAVDTYTQIIQINPKYKLAYYNIGFINLNYLKDYDAAINYFTKAIQCDPTYFEAFYNRGYSFELKGDNNNAASDYKKALDLKTNYKKAIDGLNRINK